MELTAYLGGGAFPWVIGLGFGLGVTVVMELFDLRVVLLLQSGVGQ